MFGFGKKKNIDDMTIEEIENYLASRKEDESEQDAETTPEESVVEEGTEEQTQSEEESVEEESPAEEENNNDAGNLEQRVKTLEEIVSKLTAKKPEQAPSSVADKLTDLEKKFN